MNIWEKAWMSLALIVVTGLVALAACCILSKKQVIRYTLSSDKGRILVIKEIEWAVDETIYLDRYTTDDKALEIIDSLNATLKDEK